MRALIVTNLYPTPERPRLGRFVADQVAAMRRLGADVEVFSFALGATSYLPAAARLRRLLKSSARERFDVVHAHYGLCGWVALVAGARPLIVTFHGTDIRHRLVGPGSRRLLPRLDLAAAASGSGFKTEGGRPGLPRGLIRTAVLPCGADLDRFRPIDRGLARRRLGLDPEGRYLLFAADPGRPHKRHDRAAEIAARVGAELLVAGEVDPDEMPYRINAADAVLVTSESEGFGLSCLEALACNVPVLSTPVGVAPLAAGGVAGCLVEPFDANRWASFARTALEQSDPRVEGATAARRFSAERMAERVLVAYAGLTSTPGA